jgi:hypothetical protein
MNRAKRWRSPLSWEATNRGGRAAGIMSRRKFAETPCQRIGEPDGIERFLPGAIRAVS